ncbi:hypothetical protein [Lachnoclostridium sp.]|uniref:hypothetical protein n=1 Tax=Lachnoclostridium sp. TaxID=2028282 RepID=UPI003FA55D3B
MYHTYEKNLIDVSTGSGHCIGLRKDGTVISYGSSYDGWGNKTNQAATEDWTDIVDIDAGDITSIGLRKMGRLLLSGIMIKVNVMLKI